MPTWNEMDDEQRESFAEELLERAESAEAEVSSLKHAVQLLEMELAEARHSLILNQSLMSADQLEEARILSSRPEVSE